MAGSVSVLLCCVCTMVLWPVSTATTSTTASVTASVTTAAPTRPTATAVGAGAAGPPGSPGQTATGDEQANANWDQILDGLLNLVETTVNSTVDQHWTALAARLDKLDAGVRNGSRLVAANSDAVGRLLVGQTRLETIQQGLRQLLAGQVSTQSAHGALQETLDQLQATLTQLQESQNQLQESQNQLQESQNQLQASVAQLKIDQTQILAQIGSENQHRQLASCPEGWSASGVHCFLIPPGVASWYHAERACELMHRRAKLASVHPETEQFVRRLLSDADGLTFWIGLVRQSDDPGWGWADGTALDYTAWLDGEPNNAGGAENCVQVYQQGWNDQHCSHKIKMLCQIVLE